MTQPGALTACKLTPTPNPSAFKARLGLLAIETFPTSGNVDFVPSFCDVTDSTNNAVNPTKALTTEQKQMEKGRHRNSKQDRTAPIRANAVKSARRVHLRSFLVTALIFLGALQARPQGSVGAVPATAPGTPSSGTGTTSGNTKPLPWKFLASPMGLLDSSWTPEIIGQLGTSDHWDCSKNTDCTPHRINAIVRQTMAVNLDQSPATYVAIHVVDYGSSAGNSLAETWYLYHSKDKKWNFQKFTSQRIYGSPKVLFLFIHLNARGVSAATMTSLRSGNAAEAAALEGNTTFTEQADGRTHPLCADNTNNGFQWLGNGAAVSNYANVHYDSAVVKRTPANVSNLLDILKILGYASHGATECRSIPTQPVNIWGSGRIKDIGLPSDVSIAGYSTGKDEALKDEDRAKLQIGSAGAFNDEQLYWWDASIGIPVNSVKDLQYSSSDNTVVAKQVSKQSAYAMFNLMLHPVDLSDPKSNLWPRLLVGFPLSSSPWDKLFVGGGVGLPFKPVRNFQFFAGATLNRSKQTTTLSAGQSTTNAQLQNDLRMHVKPKLTFGVNVPVKSVLDKLLK